MSKPKYGPETVEHAMITNNHRLAGDIIRYHTWPMQQNQTIANHTWNLMRIYCMLFGLPRSEVFYFLIYHDVPEMKTGDMPSYTKLNYPEFRELFDRAEAKGAAEMNLVLPKLTHEEFLNFKICDMLERIEFAFFEMMKGNRLAEPILETFRRDLKRFDLSERKQDLINTFIDNLFRYMKSSATKEA